MVAHTPIDTSLHVVDFEAAYARVNQWRGHMVENFSRAEQAVTETVIVLNGTQAGAKKAKFPHLVGQRFDRLAVLLVDLSTCSTFAKTAGQALLRFRDHEVMRAMLCHGVTKIALDRSGAWVALMKMAVFKANAVENTQLTIEEAEATQMLERVMHDRQVLSSVLGQVRREATSPSA